MKLRNGIDYFIYCEDFPVMGVHGFVGSNRDGTASIYINTLYCPREQRKTLCHELRHVALNHLWRDDMELDQKEAEAGEIHGTDVRIAPDFSWVEVTEQGE